MSFSDALFRPRAGGRSRSPMTWLSLALAARRQRRALRALPPERLRDLGISEEAARKEAEQPIWNVPAHWLR